MSKTDFSKTSSKFLPTNEQDGSDIFNVGTSSNLGIGSKLKVEVTASKNGEQNLTAESSQGGDLAAITIVEPTNVVDPVGACCVCQTNGVIECTNDVMRETCEDVLGGEWFLNTSCSVQPCADIECQEDEPPDTGDWQEPTRPRLPVARFTEVPELIREGDDNGKFYVTVSAEHVDGINRVEFYLDDEPEPRHVREVKAPHPESGYPEYLFPITVADLADGRHKVDAHVYSNSTPTAPDGNRIKLEGEMPTTDTEFQSSHARVNDGLHSFFFRTKASGMETVTVGKERNSDNTLVHDYEDIQECLDGEGVSLRGKRVQIHGEVNAGDSTTRPWSEDTNPILFEGAPGTNAKFYFGEGTNRGKDGFSRFISPKRTSVVFKDINILVPLGESSLDQWAGDTIPEAPDTEPALFGTAVSDGAREKMIAWINCRWEPDVECFAWNLTNVPYESSIYPGLSEKHCSSCRPDLDPPYLACCVDDPEDLANHNYIDDPANPETRSWRQKMGDSNVWKVAGWLRDRATPGGGWASKYSIGNTFHKVNKGLEQATLHKNDTFYHLIWDHLASNPGSGINITVDKSTNTCDSFTKHNDLVQFFSPNHGMVLRNRMFVDFKVTNHFGQLGNNESTWTKSESTHPDVILWKDWYWARWDVESHTDDNGFNMYITKAQDWTVEDFTIKQSGLHWWLSDRDNYPWGYGTDQANPPMPGFIMKNYVGGKWRSIQSSQGSDPFLAGKPEAFFTPQVIGDGFAENIWVTNLVGSGENDDVAGVGPIDWANEGDDLPDPPENYLDDPEWFNNSDIEQPTRFHDNFLYCTGVPGPGGDATEIGGDNPPMILAETSSIDLSNAGEPTFNWLNDQDSSDSGESGNISRLPVARWTEVPNIHRGSDFYVTLSAEHYHGIKEVEFRVDGGAPQKITAKTNETERDYPEYQLFIDVSELTPGRHEVTAKVTSNDGEFGNGILNLTGDPHQYRTQTTNSKESQTILDRRNNGINSFFFHTGEQETVTVGTNGDYADLGQLFADRDPRGLRVEMQGDQIHNVPSRGSTSNDIDLARKPVEIVGMEGTNSPATFKGILGKIRNVSWSIQNMTFIMEFGNGDINAVAQALSSPTVAPELSVINCTFAPDPDVTEICVKLKCDNVNQGGDGLCKDRPINGQPWRFNGWQKIHNNYAFMGGVYSVGNTYDSIALGPEKVTLSKHDKFYKLTWDHCPKNPGGVFDLYSERSSKECSTHQLHTDLIQYFRTYDENSGAFAGEPTRNRMFCDFYATNFSAQVGHFEGTQLPIDEDFFEGATKGPKIPSTYKDFYLTRWTIDSEDPGCSLNFSANTLVNWTVTDMKFSNASIDCLPLKPSRGLIFDRLVSVKLRMGDSGRLIHFPMANGGSGNFIVGETVFVDNEAQVKAVVEEWLPNGTSNDPTPILKIRSTTIRSEATNTNLGFVNTRLDFGDPVQDDNIRFIQAPVPGESSGAEWTLIPPPADSNGKRKYVRDKTINTPDFFRDNGHLIGDWWVEEQGNGHEEINGVVNVNWVAKHPDPEEFPCLDSNGDPLESYTCNPAEPVAWSNPEDIDLTIIGPQALLASWASDNFWTEFKGEQ